MHESCLFDLDATEYEALPREWIVKEIQKAGNISQVYFNKFKKTPDTNVHFLLADSKRCFSTRFSNSQEARRWMRDKVIFKASPEIPLEVCGIDVGQLAFNITMSNNRAFMAIVEEAMEQEEEQFDA